MSPAAFAAVLTASSLQAAGPPSRPTLAAEFSLSRSGLALRLSGAGDSDAAGKALAISPRESAAQGGSCWRAATICSVRLTSAFSFARASCHSLLRSAAVQQVTQV